MKLPLPIPAKFVGAEKAVTGALTTILGILGAVLTYGLVSPDYAKWVSGTIAILTPIVSYLSIYAVENTPTNTQEQATPQ